MCDRFNFTDARIKAIQPPSSGRLVVKDMQVRGLQCRISYTDVKTFCLYRRTKSGIPERITLGKYPDISVQKARSLAEQLNGSIAEGLNPAELRREFRGELTFGELFDQYLENHAKLKKRTWRDDKADYERYLRSPLGNKRISQIDRAMIYPLYTSITKQSKGRKPNTVASNKFKSGARANRILLLISRIFNYGIMIGLFERNPTRGIKRFKEKSRERFIQPDEMPRFFKSLMEEENTTLRDFFFMALLTGARKSNIMQMKWEQVSFERKEWRIPETKNGSPLTLPLGDEIMMILRDRRANAINGYVFHGEGKDGFLKEPRKGWKRILDRAEIQDLRIHDLRRTLGSWQARTGASFVVIGKTLGHKSPVSTAIYARLDIDPVRKAVEVATTAMLNSAKRKKLCLIFNQGAKNQIKTFNFSDLFS